MSKRSETFHQCSYFIMEIMAGTISSSASSACWHLLLWAESRMFLNMRGGIPLWIYHVSQLLHHTLHHLRFVLQQLRRELLVQPCLEEEKTPVTPLKASNRRHGHFVVAVKLNNRVHVDSLLPVLRSAPPESSHPPDCHLGWRRIRHQTKRPTFYRNIPKNNFDETKRAARFQHKSFLPATRALLAIFWVFFPPLLGLQGRSDLWILFYSFVPTIHMRDWFTYAIVISLFYFFKSWLC